MKIVVIGGSGLIGSKLVNRLRQMGHEVVAASPNTGVNTITGEGLAEALAGAQVVVDVANSPSFEAKPALGVLRDVRPQPSGRRSESRRQASPCAFGRRNRPPSRKRLLPREDGPGEPDQGLRHPLYDPALDAILRVHRRHHQIRRGRRRVRLSPALIQPIASDDVAAALADLAVGAPVNGTIEVAGPEQFRLDALARAVLAAKDDRRQVIADIHARYYGAELSDLTLTPSDHPRFAPTRFEDWFTHSLART